MGAAGVVLYETLIAPRIPVSGTAKNLVEMGVGLFVLSRMRNPILRSTGTALATVNAIALVAPLVGRIGSVQTADTGITVI